MFFCVFLFLLIFSEQKTVFKIGKERNPLPSMMLFQQELGWSLLQLLGRSADSGCQAPLQKQETKRIGRGPPVPFPMPKSVLSGGREDQLLRE